MSGLPLKADIRSAKHPPPVLDDQDTYPAASVRAELIFSLALALMAAGFGTYLVLI
jgi:hypothetical protein